MRYGAVISAAVNDFIADDAATLAAALAFYSVLSLAPLLLLVVGIAGLIWGKAAVGGAVVDQFGNMIGPAAAQQVQTILASAQSGSAGALSAIIGAVLLVAGATGVFTHLKAAMNTVWDVRVRSGGWRKMLRTRLLSLVMVIGIAFLFIVSLLLSTGIDALSRWLGSMLGISATLLVVLNTLLSLMLFTFVFAASFMLLPDVHMGWSDVLEGALVTALLLLAGKAALSLYFAHSSLGSAYGAAGALVIILVWIYYAAMIFFFGAELTQASMKERGVEAPPRAGAEKL